MANRNGSGGGLLLFIAGLAAIAFYGPAFATALSGSIQSMIIILSPIVGSVLMIALGVLVFRHYWSRY
jgi:hypothetical protein